jgi:hypothetical protein
MKNEKDGQSGEHVLEQKECAKKKIEFEHDTIQFTNKEVGVVKTNKLTSDGEWTINPVSTQEHCSETDAESK